MLMIVKTADSDCMYCLLYSRDEDLQALYCIPALWLFLQQFFFFFVASSAGLAKHLKFLCFPATLVLKSCSSFNTLHFLIILEKWTNSQRLEHPWSRQRYNPACCFCFVLFFMFGQSTGFFSEKVFSPFFLRKNEGNLINLWVMKNL